MRAFPLPRVPYRETQTVCNCHNSYTCNACARTATEQAIVQRLDTPRYGGTVPRASMEGGE